MHVNIFTSAADALQLLSLSLLVTGRGEQGRAGGGAPPWLPLLHPQPFFTKQTEG